MSIGLVIDIIPYTFRKKEFVGQTIQSLYSVRNWNQEINRI